MWFRSWVEQVENPVVLLDRKYLFDLGMSGARVRGEVLQAMEQVEGERLTIRAGQLGVLLDESGNYYNLAITTGFGFQPIRTEARFWSKTGVHFDGDNKKLARMSDSEMQIIPMIQLKPIEDQLRQYPQVTQVFTSEKQIRAILYDQPQGPSGYRSDYQIVINNDKPGLLSLTAVVKGETKTIQTNMEKLPELVHAAVMFVSQNR